MPQDRSKVAAKKAAARSRISNGSATFLDGVDGRSALARRYRDVLDDLRSHLGGHATATEEMICRRVAQLAVWCEAQESAAAAGEPLEIGAYTTAANTLRRLVQDLGLEQRMRDITPTLESYLTQSNGVAA